MSVQNIPSLVHGLCPPAVHISSLGFTLALRSVAKGHNESSENNTMSPIISFFQWFFEAKPQGALESHERYLAESADLFDLERRMRELDQHRPHHNVLGPFGWNA